MDSRQKPFSFPTNLSFLLLLLSTNFLTLFISTTFYSSRSLNFTATSSETAIIAIDSDNSKIILELPSEFLVFTSAQILPFRHNNTFDSDRFYPPVGRTCTSFPNELSQFMSYKVNGSCPDDELLAQKLLLKGCEPLPRRRCLPAAQPDYVEPFPLPISLWTTPSDSSVVWSAYTCKDYACLINSRNQKAFDDCKDCFDLEGRERTRWAEPISRGGLDFSIDEVLATKPLGTIRIGLDIDHGGVATFAVRMRERNITIVTTSMNLNGPFNNFIASRGVMPIYISISQRLPFFDNTLDIVHSHVLSKWIPNTLLHFLLFDIYRILRPGGLFWLDHFFCVGEQLEQVYAPLIDSVGFNQLKWVIGLKLDRGPEFKERYVSALLEKPLENSW